MKIYTRKGDDGSTGLIGGTRVSKADLRIDAYGTVDELNAWMGMIGDCHGGRHYKINIRGIQNELFTIGSHLANDAEKSRMKLPELSNTAVKQLEDEMDEWDSKLPPMKNFILPGGHPDVSIVHVGRCVCRKAERIVTKLSMEIEVDIRMIKYLNRLSDYLFVLSRMMSLELKAEEIPWLPRSKNS